MIAEAVPARISASPTRLTEPDNQAVISTTPEPCVDMACARPLRLPGGLFTRQLSTRQLSTRKRRAELGTRRRRAAGGVTPNAEPRKFTVTLLLPSGG